VAAFHSRHDSPQTALMRDRAAGGLHLFQAPIHGIDCPSPFELSGKATVFVLVTLRKIGDAFEKSLKDTQRRASIVLFVGPNEGEAP